MGDGPDARCAILARPEPVAGTAPVAAGWVCVEQRGAWPRNVELHSDPSIAALLLPTGYLYGRIDVAGAIAAGKAAGTGEVEIGRCRGRSTWSPAGQVAELAVRELTGLRDATALTVAPGEGPHVLVTAADGTR